MIVSAIACIFTAGLGFGAAEPPLVLAAWEGLPGILKELGSAKTQSDIEKLAAAGGFDFIVKEGVWYVVDQNLYGKARKERQLGLWLRLQEAVSSGGVFTLDGRADPAMNDLFGPGSMNFGNTENASYAVALGCDLRLSLGGRTYSVTCSPDPDGATRAKLGEHPLERQTKPAGGKDTPGAPKAGNGGSTFFEDQPWGLYITIVNKAVNPRNRAHSLKAVVEYLVESEDEWDKRLKKAKGDVSALLQSQAGDKNLLAQIRTADRLADLPQAAKDQIEGQIRAQMIAAGIDPEQNLGPFMSGARVDSLSPITFVVAATAGSSGRSLVVFGIR